MQKTHQVGFYKNTGSLVKVIEVRTSFNFNDEIETNNYPLVAWVVVVENANSQPMLVHQYDQPVKAFRKFERLTVK